MRTKDRKKCIFILTFIIAVLIILIILINKVNLKKVNIANNDIERKIETTLVNTQNAEKEEVSREDSEQKSAEITENEKGNNVNNDKSKDTVNEEVISEYKGYPVIAKLEIPKIELETYVISEYSEKALGVSVTKFYGGNPNEVGNFCIAGHNYITKNMFHDIKKLSNDDEIILTDLEGNCIKYEVYLIETVEPTETKCLSQKTNGRVELTLITCTTDSSKRIIVKAVETKKKQR